MKVELSREEIEYVLEVLGEIYESDKEFEKVSDLIYHESIGRKLTEVINKQ